MKPTQKREKLGTRPSRFEDSDGNSDRRDVPARALFGGEAAQSSDKIYGLIPVLEALRSGQRSIDSITIAEGARHDRMRDLLALAKKANVPVHRVPRVSLDRALKEITHQGVVARTAAARYQDADELLEAVAARVGSADQPLVLGLDGIEDPRNFGAILRTAECAGVHGVFIPERRAVGLTDTVAKAAAGAVEYVPIARATNLVRLIEQLKERNIWVVGAAAEGTSNYTDWDWTLPSALFLGSEGAGLHRLVRERCDTLVRIPVLGRLGSLNVSVAAGVLLYEALRQRAR
ncbi:MAG TPA: 23S rRNA (guanosine(2251)-2'-O)-methyltransferase RlmB [Pyrinomonadaceae bacterium]|nr:23S rRNA (guanosine(2251)-2'-O)-methyltransferase RlmB [Pyrinomonadaceae bacterium]